MTAPTTAPLRGLPLLDAVIDKITEDPAYWYQGDWQTVLDEDGDRTCGTAYCVAGWAVVLGLGITADRWVDEAGEVGTEDAMIIPVTPDLEPTDDVLLMSRCSHVARTLLGLTERQADGLFHGSNGFDTIRDLRDEIRDRAHHEADAAHGETLRD